MSFIEGLVLNIVIVVIASFALWFRIKIYISTENKLDLENKKREAFKSLLDMHSGLVLGKHLREDVYQWTEQFADMSKNILLWSSDEVLTEYGKYVQKRHKQETEILEHEIDFADAILAFRKELGYENKKNKLTPEQIVLIFRSGYKKNI